MFNIWNIINHFREPVEIDFRSQRWGHACQWKHEYKDILSGHFFFSEKVQRGDYLLIKGVKGQYKVMITELKNCRDPWDMYLFKAKWIEDIV